MPHIRPLLLLLLLPLAAVTACGDADTVQESDEAPSEAASQVPAVPVPSVELSVEVVQEAEGTPARIVAGMAATGVEIVPAGDTVAGTGHHHLYLNTDLTPIDQPVPTIPGAVVHLGDGSRDFSFDGVPPGEHRMIAVLADGLHFPLRPWVVDTVFFTVR